MGTFPLLFLLDVLDFFQEDEEDEFLEAGKSRGRLRST